MRESRPLSKKELAIRLGVFCMERTTMYRRVDTLLGPHKLRRYAPGRRLYVIDLDSAPEWIRALLGEVYVPLCSNVQVNPCHAEPRA